MESGKQASAGLARAPYLAPVDLAARAKQLGVEGEAGLHVVPQMLAYFARFQAKAVAFVDLVKYVALLDAQERERFAEGLAEIERKVDAEVRSWAAIEEYVAVPTLPPRQVAGPAPWVVRCLAATLLAQLQVVQEGSWQMPQIRVMVNSMRLKQAMGLPEIASAADARAHASACAERYAAWRPVAESCGSTEFGVGEEAVEAAVVALVAAYGYERDMADIAMVRASSYVPRCSLCMRCRDPLPADSMSGCFGETGPPDATSQCLQAVALLEGALQDRPSSPALRLALCGLASLLGMAAVALEQADALQLRQVQFDSMAHHLLPALSANGRDRRAATLFRQARCSTLVAKPSSRAWRREVMHATQRNTACRSCACKRTTTVTLATP